MSEKCPPIEEAREIAKRSSAEPANRGGAVVVTEANERFLGVTINLTGCPGLSIAAEQVALCGAKATSTSPIREIALWIPEAAGDLPGGDSLQVWLELAPEASFLLQRGDREPKPLDLATLLPDAFRDFRS